jgi:predicted cupin superfamily sugar epimerase
MILILILIHLISNKEVKKDMPDYIKRYNLIQHVEGGYFGVFFTSEDKVSPLHERYLLKITPSDSNNVDESKKVDQLIERSACSSIYFLLEKNAYSSWHRLKSDEIWHYYHGGSPIEIHIIDEHGCLTTNILGNPAKTEGASFHVVVKA